MKVSSCLQPSIETTIERDILENQMHSASHFFRVEELSRTQIVGLMTQAKNCAFTV